jgi:(1->4)-alpha-D-glucan 1-alpha-D-glucosylmutase
MTVPHATYRLQFRGDVDFEKAAGLAPYLARLGVSHLYASPLFQATPGSTHGYDVTDHGKFDESLGGDGGFELLSTALRDNGLGLILDIVPNHMAASCHNPWWADVLRHGRESRYAGHFDIDWSPPKLLLPILGRPYGDALAAEEFSLGHDADGLTWQASGQALPLDPKTWPLVLQDLAETSAPGLDAEPASFRTWLGEADNASHLAVHLATISRDQSRMHQIHEAQNWRLAYWRAARDMLDYRRFFEISDLVGVRVEDAWVFDDVHHFLFELVEAGHVDGVRVDHVDGLADPKGYLERLARCLPRPAPIWVEKILEREERLPAGWPVAGATGYEFLAMTSAALTDGAAEPELDRAYAAYCGATADFAAMRNGAKREVLTRNLAAELETLVGLLRQAFAADLSNRDWGPDSLRRAAIALLVAMPVYRTYVTTEGGSDSDRAVVAGAVGNARFDPWLDDPAAIDAIAGCLLSPENSAAREFRARFQQISGALMAKTVEDTVFYRFNRLASANEVGADPSKIAIDAAAFHAFATERASTAAMALNATATHDTKRGEDARMRIAALAEDPAKWGACVARFDAILAGAGVPDIDASSRWLFYQALLGSWRPDLSDNLPERIGAFLLKAAREAKVRTSWVKTNQHYELQLQQFVERTLSHGAFVEAFADCAPAFIAIGERKSLIQLALKLTLPGIPDIYQGTEVADLSFVDPDNRRSVDFGGLATTLSHVEAGKISDFNERKLSLLSFGLRLRRNHADVFAGGYRPLAVEASPGRRLLAFARDGRTATLIVAAELSGDRPVASGAISPARAEQRRLGEMIDAFPSRPAAEIASPDRGMVPHLTELGLSIRLFAE